MKTNATVQINPATLEETVAHVSPEFPYMSDLCDLHDYPGNEFPWHWHGEVEFFYMREGRLDYLLPSGKHTFYEGEGAFINANVLHMTRCEKTVPCVQEEHIFQPQFIGGARGSVLMQKYVLPITENPDFELMRMDPACRAHAGMMMRLREAHQLYVEKPEGYEFDLREKMTQVWRSLYALTKDMQQSKKPKITSDRIKRMMAYISAHYPEKLTLSQIAASGHVSIRECCRCFQVSLGVPPFSYLMDYRLHKACDLLSHMALSITEIAIACGFHTSSYFGKSFREKFGCTPKEYREAKR